MFDRILGTVSAMIAGYGVGYAGTRIVRGVTRAMAKCATGEIESPYAIAQRHADAAREKREHRAPNVFDEMWANAGEFPD